MAREYLAMAEQLLHPPHPCLVAVGGLSGSGKSTLALGLAPSIGAVPGAVVLRSDETRKRLCGVPLLQRLGPEGYSSQVSERVYSTLAEQAALVLRAGHSVVVDAVYARAADRRVIEQVAEAASVPFIGLWLDAPESLLIDRTAQRRNDASDADANVVRMQRAQDIGDIRWSRLDASGPAASVLSTATDSVRERLQDVLNVVADEAVDHRVSSISPVSRSTSRVDAACFATRACSPRTALLPTGRRSRRSSVRAERPSAPAILRVRESRSSTIHPDESQPQSTHRSDRRRGSKWRSRSCPRIRHNPRRTHARTRPAHSAA